MAAARYAVPAEKVAFYRAHGWVVLDDIVSPAEVARLRALAEDMVAGRIDTRANRADLGAHVDRVSPLTENIIQIGWPCDLTSLLDENELVQSARAAVKAVVQERGGTPLLLVLDDLTDLAAGCA
jgi:hypothetical protein